MNDRPTVAFIALRDPSLPPGISIARGYGR